MTVMTSSEDSYSSTVFHDKVLFSWRRSPPEENILFTLKKISVCRYLSMEINFILRTLVATSLWKLILFYVPWPVPIHTPFCSFFYISYI